MSTECWQSYTSWLGDFDLWSRVLCRGSWSSVYAARTSGVDWTSATAMEHATSKVEVDGRTSTVIPREWAERLRRRESPAVSLGDRASRVPSLSQSHCSTAFRNSRSLCSSSLSSHSRSAHAQQVRYSVNNVMITCSVNVFGIRFYKFGQ